MKPLRNTRVYKIWDHLRSSYWFLPSLMVLTSAALALALIVADQYFTVGPDSRLAWLFLGRADSARSILATIATSMVTVVSLTFSMTVVVLTLASSQFGPRLLYNFMRDRSNQVVLGVFVACFVFCLLVLRSVQSQAAGEQIPHLSVNAAIVFAVLSIGVLIYFIHHIADSIQADTVIARVRHELESVVMRNVPEPSMADTDDAQERERLLRLSEAAAAAVGSDQRGVLQAIEHQTIVDWAEKHDVLVVLHHRPGDFAIQGNCLLSVFPAERLPRDDVKRLEQAFTFGRHRTLVQDVEFAFQQLVEIAVRALSPGINDPFTAMSCVDELGSGLALMASRGVQTGLLRDTGGTPRVLLKPFDFEGVADTAFNQIRQNGATHPAVMIRMLETIATVAESLQQARHRAPLARHARAVHAAARERATDTDDRADIDKRLKRAITLLGADNASASSN